MLDSSNLFLALLGYEVPLLLSNASPSPPLPCFQVSMGSMRHRRNGNFESSRLLYSSMSRSIDVACSDAVSTWYMLVLEGPHWW